jgi:hypothetical protein
MLHYLPPESVISGGGMRHLDIERKRTTAWPWVAGLAIFAIIAWSVTSLLAAAEDEPETADAAIAEDTLPPTAIPMPPAPVRDMGAARSVDELTPLSEEHAGEVVTAQGEVVATGSTGFWIMTAGYVLRVDSNEAVRKGETVVVRGIIQLADGEERTDQIAAEVLSRDPGAESWEVVRAVKLVEEDQQ